MQNRKPPRRPWAPILAFLAVTIVPSAASFEGGGTINNVEPYFAAFWNLAPTMTAGATDEFFGVVVDGNAEDDIVSVRFLEASTPEGESNRRLVTPEDLVVREEPASFGADGWKVWNPDLGDGALSFKFQFTYPEDVAAEYSFESFAADEATESIIDAPRRVSVYLPLHVLPDPVDRSGNILPGARWGGWRAFPNQADIHSHSLLVIVNGPDPDAAVLLDFTDGSFGGLSKAAAIPIDGNVRFVFFEDTTPASSSPLEAGEAPLLSFPGEVSAAGKVELRFMGAGNVMYVAYQLALIPNHIPDQDYAAAFTVTEL